MRKYIWKTAVMLCCIIGLFAGKTGYTALAKEEQYVTSLSGDVAMFRQVEKGYDMQVTVENSGEDFTGTVQVIFAGLNAGNCAYNTEITLPAQGKKQFTIRVPDTAVDTARGMCALNFVDEKGNTLQSEKFSNVFRNTMTMIPVGILSENYEGLAYMEAKGGTLDIRGMNYPFKLSKLQGDNLKEQLAGVYFLVIDQFDMSALQKEDVQAIEDWVKGGGCLLIGTGEYAEQTLSGFDRDFMDAYVKEISEPGEGNVLSSNIDRNEYYYSRYTEDGIDFTEVTVAALDIRSVTGYFYENMENPAMISIMDRGAVMVFFCSFGEAELQKADGNTIASIYQELMDNAGNYFADDDSEWGYVRQKCFAFMDHINTDVDFTWLKVMILAYVVLVGPVLYLILRKCKKCEWYWIGVPAFGVLFIAGVYVLGRDIRVNEARVYSVTAQRADGDRADTYLMAYHAGTEPWEVALRDTGEMAGPDSAGNQYYYNGSSRNVDWYHYIVESGSRGLSVGIKPEENFDNGFFYAAGSAQSRGKISCGGLKRVGSAPEGTVTNQTDCDMAYLALFYNGNILVFSDVKAGETIDLQRDYRSGKCVYEFDFYNYSPNEVLHDMLSIYSYRDDKGYAQDDMAALLIGMGVADDERQEGSKEAVIVGVVKNYDRATVGRCSELSYGCLYSYVEMEGGPHASN